MIRRTGDEPVIQQTRSEETEHHKPEKPVTAGDVPEYERPERSSRDYQKSVHGLSGQLQQSSLQRQFLENRAEAVQSACKGIGTDEDAVYKNLSGLSPQQRKELDQIYQEKYGMSLEQQLRSEMSGPELDKALDLLYDGGSSTKSLQDRADAIHNASKGIGTDEAAIYRSLSGLSAQQRQELDQIYQQKYGMSLEQQLKSELSGPELDRALGLLHGRGTTGQAQELERSSKREPAVLGRGSNGPAVAELQKKLNEWLTQNGKPPLDADGAFGPKTEQALKEFQLASGLNSDGVMGPHTRERLGI